MSNVHRFREFQTWKTSNGISNADGWSKSDKLDHVCRPVIVGADGRTKPVVLGHPQHHNKNKLGEEHKVQQFISNVQSAVSEIKQKTSLPGGIFKRRNHSESYPNGMTRSEPGIYDESEPKLINSEGFERPSPAGWSMPPQVPLKEATNDAGASGNYLRESAKHQSVTTNRRGRRNSAPSSALPDERKVAFAIPTIDSSEAAKKYNGKFVW